MRYTLKDNKTRKNPIYETEVEINKNGCILELEFHAKHSTFNSFSSIYNDDIWKADVCEIFLYTGIKNHYYEIEVAPNGTLFFGDIFNDGKNRVLTKLENNCLSGEVTHESNNYVAKLRLDMSKLDGDKKNLKFNAFRIETDGEIPEKYLFAVSPTMCGSFHEPQYFIDLK